MSFSSLNKLNVFVLSFSTWCSDFSPSKYSSNISIILFALMHFSAALESVSTDGGNS